MVTSNVTVELVGTRWRVGVVLSHTRDPMYKVIVMQSAGLWPTHCLVATHSCYLFKSLFSECVCDCRLEDPALSIHPPACCMDDQGYLCYLL